jgi:hypothetical protein
MLPHTACHSNVEVIYILPLPATKYPFTLSLLLLFVRSTGMARILRKQRQLNCSMEQFQLFPLQAPVTCRRGSACTCSKV